MENIRFDGQVAIITGAARGIGLAHAKFLGSRGAKLVINDVAGIDEAVAELKAEGIEVVGDNHDISSMENAQKIIDKAIETYGHLEILVNNAAVNQSLPIDVESDEKFDFILKVNVYGTRNLCKAAYPIFKEQKYGRIINTTSGVALYGVGGLCAYSVSKGAVLGLTKGLAVDGAEYDIKVNVIAPSAATVMALKDSGFEVNDPATIEAYKAAMPTEAIPVVLGVLASKDCPVTGKVFETCGGRVNEIFLAATCGYYDPTFTPEVIAEKWDTVVDREDFAEFNNAIESNSFFEVAVKRQYAKEAEKANNA